MGKNETKALRKGDAGENEVSRILSGFNRKQYYVINNVLLEKPNPVEGEIPTVQIDHIVVSIYGIFTIETKNYSGSVYGTEEAKNWSEYVGGKEFQIPNPLRQNYAHAKTLQSLLNNNSEEIGIKKAFFPISQIIAFSDQTTLKVSVSGADVVHFKQIPDAILFKSQKQCLSLQQVEAIANFIISRNIYSADAMREHVAAIVRKQGELNGKSNAWNLTVGDSSNSFNQAEKYEYLPDVENRYVTPRNYKQYESDDESIKYKEKKGSRVALTVSLIAIGIILLIIFICCCGGTGLLSCGGNNNSSSFGSRINTITETKVEQYGQIDNECLSQLKTEAEEAVKLYIDNNSKDETNYKDLLDSYEYIGECFGLDDENGNELFVLYKLHNSSESIDNVNLQKFTTGRSIYYFVGFRNIVKKSDGTYGYDETLHEPESYTSDFSSKSIYNVININLTHPGYMFVTDMLDDIENMYSNTEYNPGKESIISSNHLDSIDITDYADYFGHSFVKDYGGYIDASGEEYRRSITTYYHSVWTDPTCIDFRVGTEYNTLTFTHAGSPQLYPDYVTAHYELIDKDTFETFYVGNDIAKNQSSTEVVDISNHKNIRIQFVPEGSAVAQVFVKDVVLSNR